jgi:hypothetical protein
MGEVKTSPVEARLVGDLFGGGPPRPGAIRFYDSPLYRPAGFHFSCPCGCGAIGAVKVEGDGSWRWNGSREMPTVHPSVALSIGPGEPHWHGYLTDGVWTSC